MNADDIRITLVAASDDAPLENDEYQKELRAFVSNLRDQKVRYSPQFRTMDAAAGITPGWYTGAFAVAKEALPTVLLLVVAWMHSRKGRKVRFKDGEKEFEAPTVREVKKLLGLIQEKPKRSLTKQASRKKP